jgi:2,4-dienoyl-CoA reductase-like NADH-dependent reductase (Old Yellow Enzyme family)
MGWRGHVLPCQKAKSAQSTRTIEEQEEDRMESLLFTPMDLRGVRLRNRIVVSPMLTYSAKQGYAGDWHYVHYGRFATGGAGLIFVESTKADPRGCTTPNDLGLWKDEFVPQLRRIAEFAKGHGAAIGIQLGHSGRKARNALPWQGRKPLASHPGVDHGEDWELIGPSAIAQGNGYFMPRALTVPDIEQLIAAYGKAAGRAHRASFDALEIHGAHGYLLHQFLSPASNQRDDAYGGTPEKRMRFALEIAEEVRRHWPDDKPLFYRVSAVDEAGWSVEDSAGLARELEKKGVDVIDCSSGGMTGRSIVDPEKPPSYGYQVPYAAGIRKLSGVKTMAVGHIIHADQAEQILREGSADLVAIGREFLQNPNWPVDAAEKLGVPNAFGTVPSAYGYWLEKRASAGFGGKPSTWQSSIKG